jgi:hypothetical protein
MTHFPYHHRLPEEEEPRFPLADWVLLVIILLLVVAVVYFSPKATYPPQAGVTAVGWVAVNENPELLAFRRYQSDAEIAAAEQLARQSPEVLTAQRYLDQLAASQDSEFLAQNPEVRLYQRYQAGQR